MTSAIVVGAGVFGASVAHRLTCEGWDVLLVDRDEPAHPRAESGGETRLIRFSHGGDGWYTRSARRALALWREIEQEAGRQLLVQAGVAWFATREDGWEAASERVLREEGIPVERLSPADAARLYPSLRTDDLSFVLLEPDAGVLRAREATRALVELALGRGARLELGEAEPAAGGVQLNGRLLEADSVVWACGAWLGRLFPRLVELRVTQQDIFFFEAGPEWSTPPVPGFVDYDGAAYGLGALDGNGVKVAPDVDGPALDPDLRSRRHRPENERRARDYLRARFPALANAPLAASTVCQYSLTPDTRFIVAPHPAHRGVWLLGGGSGHSFKHGPALAERVLELLEERAEPDPRLASGPRPPGRGLRTAGIRQVY
jgi:sarcosine oxidase